MRALRHLRGALQRTVGSVVRWQGVVSLAYHRVGDGAGSPFDRGLWSATPEAFDAQLRWLKSNFDPIAPSDLRYVLRARRGRHVLVTFDDGYGDNHATAFPILRGRRVPATFFVAAGFIDEPRLSWWDEIAWMVRASERPSLAIPGRLRGALTLDSPDRERAIRTLLCAYKALPARETGKFLEDVAEATGTGRYTGAPPRGMWMTWDDVRALRDGGMSIGGHGLSHQVLARMEPEQQRADIAVCGRRLEGELGAPMTLFSYPVGSVHAFDEVTRSCLREAGVRTAFSYYGGFRSLDAWDDLDVPRIAVDLDTSFHAFRAAALAPWFTRRKPAPRSAT